jgi:hypothetical protein
MFFTIGFLVCQILNIAGSQIEIEKIYFLHEYILFLGDVICNQII